MTHAGRHVESKSIEVRIKNQPFTPYEIQENENNWTINFYYNIRIKGYFTEDWIELYRASDGYPTQSDSQYTIISYALGVDADTELGTKMIKLPAGGQVDFQVEAMIGYISREYAGNYGPFSFPWVFTGETSGWSNTQTLIISTTVSTTTPSTSPSQNATAPSDQSNSQNTASSSLDWAQLATLTLLGVIAVLLVIVVVYLHRRNTK